MMTLGFHTDSLLRPEGVSNRAALTAMQRSYRQIIHVAEAHQVIVNVEPHGYFTTNPDMMEEKLRPPKAGSPQSAKTRARNIRPRKHVSSTL